MKIIHTADWHLGQKFYRFDRDEEQADFFRQLKGIMRSERPDALVVSGDIFDSALPSAAMESTFVGAVLSLREASPATTIVITSGNHDSGSRLEAVRLLWKSHGVHVFGTGAGIEGRSGLSHFIVDIHGADGGLCGYVLAAPFFYRANYPAVSAEGGDREAQFFEALEAEAIARNSSDLPIVLMAHLAIAGNLDENDETQLIGSLETETLDKLGCGYDYLALGHLHRPKEVGKCGLAIARYGGSPIPLSFVEEYEHSVSVVEMGKHGEEPKVRTIEIKPVRKMLTIKAKDLEEALREFNGMDASDNSYVRLLVDPEDGLLAPDAEERANMIARDKACRFCGVFLAPRRNQSKGDEDDIKSLEVEEMAKISAMDIARRFYEKKFGVSLSDELSSLLDSAIKEVKKQNSQL